MAGGSLSTTIDTIRSGVIDINLDYSSIIKASGFLQQAPDKIQKAISPAINRALEHFKTIEMRETAKKYYVKQKDIRQSIILKRSSGGLMDAFLIARGHRQPITKFAVSPKKNPVKQGSFRGAVKRAGGLKPIPLQDITMLNKMSEGFTQRVAEMTQAWQPFKASLGEGFEQIFTVMQGVADKIRGVTIPAVNELVSTLSKVASEIQSIVQAGELSVKVNAPNTKQASSIGANPFSGMAGGRNKVGRRALGGFINRPELSLIGEAGREVVVPLENRARGIPLWRAAGEELGFSFGNSTTTNNNRSVTMSPNINITVNGGDGNTAQKFRQIVEDVLSDLQDQERRLSFA